MQINAIKMEAEPGCLHCCHDDDTDIPPHPGHSGLWAKFMCRHGAAGAGQNACYEEDCRGWRELKEGRGLG